MKLDHREIFILAAKALVESYKRESEINDFLYSYGIDIANYNDPAYSFLEKFISKYYDDKYGNIMDCLFALAEFDDVTTVEKIYDFFFKEE